MQIDLMNTLVQLAGSFNLNVCRLSPAGSRRDSLTGGSAPGWNRGLTKRGTCWRWRKGWIGGCFIIWPTGSAASSSF